MEPVPLAVQEEIALEGLDGITLDSKLKVKFPKLPHDFSFFYCLKSFSVLVSNVGTS